MSTSETQTQSFTTADVGRVLDSFAADFDGISQSTGLWTRENVKAVAADVKLMASRGFLAEVSLCLSSAEGVQLRAARYTVNTSAGALAASRPGDHLWPQIPDGVLSVVVQQTDTWRHLPEPEKEAFSRELNRRWTDSSIDTSFPTLRATDDRSYVSSGYGLQRSTYR
jgi:hypothetical protein